MSHMHLASLRYGALTERQRGGAAPAAFNWVERVAQVGQRAGSHCKLMDVPVHAPIQVRTP